MLKSLCVLFSVLFVAPLASAEIFKCLGKHGEDLYQNFPCQFESVAGIPKDGPAPKKSPAAPAEPRLGMTTDEVRVIWGEPTEVVQEEPGNGPRFEVWSYGASQSVRFDRRGRVTVYLMRNIQGNTNQMSGYEVWDVTDVQKPVLASALRNIRSTHKHWWECNTGIAYLPGSKDATFGLPLWRQAQSMVIVDWKNPLASPTYIRTYGLVGSQPDASGPVPPSLHGPISAHEHPFTANKLARGATADDIIGNRVYAAWGVGDDGVLTILDRKKLLPAAYGGTWDGSNPDNPSEEQLLAPLAGILYMSPDQGGHTSFPVFGLKPSSYQAFTEFQTRDIVLLASESTADLCDEAPHWSFVVDVTVENSKSAPPGTRVQQNVFQGPMVLSTMSVDPFEGEKYPRGNYCSVERASACTRARRTSSIRCTAS